MLASTTSAPWVMQHLSARPLLCSQNDRGGLVGPWTALSPLMALCTDPLEEIRGRALRMLRLLCDK